MNDPGPIHLNVAPVMSVVACNVTEEFRQFNTSDTLAVAVGSVTFCKTFIVAKEVHPSTGLVTISVYNPGKETSGFWLPDENPPGPDHEKLTPDVVDEPARVIELALQFNVAGAAMLAPGGVHVDIAFSFLS
jgi:hypothetical protein